MSEAKKSDIDPMLQRALTLVTLHRQARHKGKLTDLLFLMVNQTFNLVKYRQCFFFRWDGHSPEVEAASGLVHLDPNGPCILWLKSVLSRFLKGKEVQAAPPEDGKKADESYARIFPIGPADCADADRIHWPDWASPHALVLAMAGEDRKIHYGLWIDREEPFQVTDIALLDDIADAYAYALQKSEGVRGGGSKLKRLFSLGKRKFLVMMICAVLSLFLPVRMSVTAPAEVVARSPLVVSVPFDGILESVVVKPDQVVKKGDLLAVMDGTALRNKSEMVSQELLTAAAALAKTEREAFKDPSKLSELNVLKAQIEAKQADKQYASELLSKINIIAGMDGVVIFPDANALRGRPVQAGEQIMLMSDPADSELLIRIPVDGMIVLDTSQPVNYFLNVAPLGSQAAEIDSIGYQATPDHDGLLTYKVRARFQEGVQHPRLGSTGSAKAYGDKTLLVFNIFRRPIVTIRRKLGI